MKFVRYLIIYRAVKTEVSQKPLGIGQSRRMCWGIVGTESKQNLMENFKDRYPVLQILICKWTTSEMGKFIVDEVI